jgi:tetratricopeptide (TPR) repeat protein
MKYFSCLIAGCLLLTACAPAPVRPVSAQSDAAPEPQAEAAPTLRSESGQVLPNVELSGELLYKFLLSEIASQRGYKALAAEAGADLVKKSRDPRLAKRAAQMAFEAGDMEKAIVAIRRWQEIEPGSMLAGHMLSSILLRGGRLDEAQPELARMLKEDGANAGGGFLRITQLLAPYPDKAAALKLMRELAQPYPQLAEAHWSVAQLAQIADDNGLALVEARQARSLRPEWNLAVALEAQLLQKDAPQEGLEVLRRYLSSYPEAREIRLQYARALLQQKQFQQSRDEFQRLADDSPDNTDLAFALAMISLQLNDLQGAETQLKLALGKGGKDKDTVQYYLGQLSEARKNGDEALTHYREVKGGEYRFAAQLRAAYLLGKSGKLEEALVYLHQAEATDNQQRVQLVLVEAQLLREAKRTEEAYKVLQRGLAKLPSHPDLLYETAMYADKLGDTHTFEKLMRKLIQLKPDHAQAYNALGYSLLERNERIEEAMRLVEKALQLAPGDFAIMDSVGWGYYRSGKLDESVAMLRRAFAGNPDPEIASHLGEVLWVRGEQEEAKKIWQDNLKANPDNAFLQAVMKRFIP